MPDLVRGCALLLGLLLLSAGAPKMITPRYAASALRRVIPRKAVPSDRLLVVATRLLGAWEVLLAAALVFLGSVLVALAVAVTFLGFLGFVFAAVRAGASCGCWASLSEGPAGGAEIARTAAMTALAGIVLAGRVSGVSAVGVSWPALGWAVAALLLVFAAAAAGGRIAPVRSERVARQLRYQAPVSRLGRLGAWLSFHAGFLHAGTDAGRRRYALARKAPGRLARR